MPVGRINARQKFLCVPDLNCSIRLHEAVVVTSGLSRCQGTGSVMARGFAGAEGARRSNQRLSPSSAVVTLSRTGRCARRNCCISERGAARCQSEGFLGRNDPEVVAVSAWSMVHGLAALWISGRLGERIREKDPNRLADRVSRLYVDSVLRAMAP